ncbi:MAG: glycerate kinase [Bacteroidales bacterium]|jgi:glycerate kinase
MDSFKGSLTSRQAGEAVFHGLEEACRYLGRPVPHTTLLPLADGGEGTVTALMEGLGGAYHSVMVCGPLGTPVKAVYGIVPADNKAGNLRESPLAVIEMAAAAGLDLVPEDKRNPLYTSTYGVGQLIIHALEQGCRTFLIGIGGSATNDGGIGMLTALGFVFKDKQGNITGHCGKDLEHIDRIVTDNVHPLLKACTFRVACDVTNPLTGPDGAAAVYGPQKGATPAIVQRLDRGLARFARVAVLAEAKTPELLERVPGNNVVSSGKMRDILLADKATGNVSADKVTGSLPADKATGNVSADNVRRAVPLDRVPGAGAAGGLGYAFLRFLNGSLEPGADLVIDVIGLREHVRTADVIITGEGRLDSQTSMGKAPAAVARLAAASGKRVVAFCGSIVPDADAVNLFNRAVAVTPPGGLFEDAGDYLRQAARSFFKEFFTLT